MNNSEYIRMRRAWVRRLKQVYKWLELDRDASEDIVQSYTIRKLKALRGCKDKECRDVRTRALWQEFTLLTQWLYYVVFCLTQKPVMSEKDVQQVEKFAAKLKEANDPFALVEHYVFHEDEA